MPTLNELDVQMEGQREYRRGWDDGRAYGLIWGVTGVIVVELCLWLVFA